jgi:hypothetical protein
MHKRKMERALTTCFLFHYVDSLLPGSLTVEVIVMAHIPDNIWHSRMKYSPCFAAKITAWYVTSNMLWTNVFCTQNYGSVVTGRTKICVCLPLRFPL